jgi:anti-sigma regulatory factor (Ser/Thr protein kinase)
MVALLTSEIVTNSVLYSDSHRPGNTITVTVTGTTDGIRVEVLDAGGASVPSLACADDADDADDEVTDHGHGLRLVSALSAGWGYHRDGAGLVTWFDVRAEPGA